MEGISSEMRNHKSTLFSLQFPLGMPEDMWTPYKHLYKVIEKSLMSSDKNSISELDMCLKKYKQTFTTLLKNPVR